MDTRAKGRSAESIAAEFLSNSGYMVIERNYFIYGGELDLIAAKEGQIIFVEVKSIPVKFRASATELLSRKKVRRIERSINNWLLVHSLLSSDWRFDYIAVIIGLKNEIIHLQNVEL